MQATHSTQRLEQNNSKPVLAHQIAEYPGQLENSIPYPHSLKIDTPHAGVHRQQGRTILGVLALQLQQHQTQLVVAAHFER